MRLLFTFITLIFAYLLSAGSLIHNAGATCNHKYEKVSTITSHKYSQSCLSNGDVTEDEVSNIVIVLDDDDEDNIVKKPVLIARYAVAFLHSFLLSDPFHHHADRILPVDYIASTGSPKYIVQRVIRI